MIMDVGFEMVGKVGDPGGQQGHLHLRRSRVARRGGVITPPKYPIPQVIGSRSSSEHREQCVQSPTP